MSMIVHERPGVYSKYDASSAVSGRAGRKIVGLVAVNTTATAGVPVVVTSAEQAVAAFGSGEMTKMISAILGNGAGGVVAIAIASATDYESAFVTLGEVEDVSIVVCDSRELAVQQALRDQVTTDSGARRERIAVVTGETGENAAALVVRANALNSPRVVLVAPGGNGMAAAVAGAIAVESDPAIPLGGAVLQSEEVVVNYSDNDLDLLIRGGVTPVERIGNEMSVVRGITTCTKVGEVEDKTWRELTTILIVDDVIPSIRNALRAKFKRAKNREQSRGAIRAQVILELENKLGQEIITEYDNVSVVADESEPTICQVSFAFTTAHALNQIWITAHITV